MRVQRTRCCVHRRGRAGVCQHRDWHQEVAVRRRHTAAREQHMRQKVWQSQFRHNVESQRRCRWWLQLRGERFDHLLVQQRRDQGDCRHVHATEWQRLHCQRWQRRTWSDMDGRLRINAHRTTPIPMQQRGRRHHLRHMPGALRDSRERRDVGRDRIRTGRVPRLGDRHAALAL